MLCVHPRITTLWELFFSTPLLRAWGDSGRTLYGSNYSTNLYSTCAPAKAELWQHLFTGSARQKSKTRRRKVRLVLVFYFYLAIKQLSEPVSNRFALSQTCSRKETYRAGIIWSTILIQCQLGTTFIILFPKRSRSCA